MTIISLTFSTVLEPKDFTLGSNVKECADRLWQASPSLMVSFRTIIARMSHLLDQGISQSLEPVLWSANAALI